MIDQKEAVVTQAHHFSSAINSHRPTSLYHDAICRAFGSENSKAFLDIMSVRHLTRGQLIFGEKDATDTLAVVASGLVKLIYPLPDGRQQIVGLLFGGDTLWQRLPSTHEFLAETTCDLDVCIFAGQRFSTALDANPVQRDALHSKALDDLDSARAQLPVLGRMTSMERVAAVLMKLAYAGKKFRHSSKSLNSNLPLILLPMTRQEMADYLWSHHRNGLPKPD